MVKTDLYYMGVDVKIYRVNTTNDNFTGERQETYGREEIIKARWHEAAAGSSLVKSGFARTGNYVLYSDSVDNLKKGDKVIILDETYLIKDHPQQKGIHDNLIYNISVLSKSSKQ